MRAVTKENGSSWIFDPCLTCANALRRVQHPAFSLVCLRWRAGPAARRQGQKRGQRTPGPSGGGELRCRSWIRGTGGQPNVKGGAQENTSVRVRIRQPRADWRFGRWIRTVTGEVRRSDGVFLRTFRKNTLITLLDRCGERCSHRMHERRPMWPGRRQPESQRACR